MTAEEGQLHPETLRTLFGNTLYGIDNGEPQQGIPEKADHTSPYLVVLDEPALPTSTQYQLLSGILAACKLDQDTVQFLTAGTSVPTYDELRKRFGSRFVFMFGVTPQQVGLPVFFPHYQAQGHDGVTYISSPGLAEIEHDKAAKSKLWQGLKSALSI